MPKPKRNQSRWSLLLLFIVAAGLLLLIVLTGKERVQLSPVEDLLLALFAPALTAFSSAGQKMRSFFDTEASFYDLKAENARLRQELSFMLQLLVQLQ